MAQWKLSEDTTVQPPGVSASSGATFSTASFTPRAGQLLVAMVIADGGPSTVVTAAVTDSTGGTWTLLRRSNTSSASIGGSTEVWCRYLNTAPGAMTVTCTSSTTAGGLIVVRVLNGAAPVQPGATAIQGGGTVASTVPLAATSIGSRVYGLIELWNSSTAQTVSGVTTAVSTFSNTTNGTWYAAFRSTDDNSSTAAVAYGVTGGATTAWQIVAVEIRALPEQPSQPGMGQPVNRASSW